MTPRFRGLDGLPPYGPAAEPFSATGAGMHREGLVVELVDAAGVAWIGNFQRGGAGSTPSWCAIARASARVQTPPSPQTRRRCIRGLDNVS